MSNCIGDNEQKPNLLEFFKSKGANAVENYSTGLKFKLNLRILHIFIPNFNLKCHFVMEVISGH